jgi:hypothetical protein
MYGLTVLYTQAKPDYDNDGIPDDQDPDDDNDGVPDVNDAFPYDPTEWADADNDGIGNNADPDDDNDGVADTADNCPLVANPHQQDRDLDSIGDACDHETWNGRHHHPESQPAFHATSPP